MDGWHVVATTLGVGNVVVVAVKAISVPVGWLFDSSLLFAPVSISEIGCATEELCLTDDLLACTLPTGNNADRGANYDSNNNQRCYSDCNPDFLPRPEGF